MKTSSPSRSLILTADEVRDALAGKIVQIVEQRESKWCWIVGVEVVKAA